MCFRSPIGGVHRLPALEGCSCVLSPVVSFQIVCSLSHVKTCFYSDYSEDVRNFCLCLAAEWKRINDSVSEQQEQQAWIQSLASFIFFLFSYQHTLLLASLSLRGINPDPKNSHYHPDRSQGRVKRKRREDRSDLHSFAPKSHSFAPIQDVFNHLQTLHSWNLRGT